MRLGCCKSCLKETSLVALTVLAAIYLAEVIRGGLQGFRRRARRSSGDLSGLKFSATRFVLASRRLPRSMSVTSRNSSAMPDEPLAFAASLKECQREALF